MHLSQNRPKIHTIRGPTNEGHLRLLRKIILMATAEAIMASTERAQPSSSSESSKCLTTEHRPNEDLPSLHREEATSHRFLRRRSPFLNSKRSRNRRSRTTIQENLWSVLRVAAVSSILTASTSIRRSARRFSRASAKNSTRWPSASSRRIKSSS